MENAFPLLLPEFHGMLYGLSFLSGILESWSFKDKKEKVSDVLLWQGSEACLHLKPANTSTKHKTVFIKILPKHNSFF